MQVVKEGVDGAVAAEGIFFWGSEFLRLRVNIPHVTVEGEVEQTICGIRLSSEYVSLLRLTKSISSPRIFVVAVSRCLDFSGLLSILCTLRGSKPYSSMFALMYSESRVAKLYPLILFIPTSMSTLRIPRSLSRTQPPVKRKTRRSSSGLSLSISCAASTRSLRTAASSGERARVCGAVGIVGVVIVLYLFEALVGGEDVVVVVAVGMSRLRFRSGLFAGDGERVCASTINTRGKRILGESKNCDLRSGRSLSLA